MNIKNLKNKKIMKKIMSFIVGLNLIWTTQAHNDIDAQSLKNNLIVEKVEQRKKQITKSHRDALILVNVTLNLHNWHIGQMISEHQKDAKWGSHFIENIIQDLKTIYPDLGGCSQTSIYHMRAFYERYQRLFTNTTEYQNHVLFKIPWSHNIVILEKIKDLQEALWYIKQTYEHDWSRAILQENIKKKLYQQQHTIKKTSNS